MIKKDGKKMVERYIRGKIRVRLEVILRQI